MMHEETFRLHPLRIPSGWTLRHNSFVDAPFEHSWRDYSDVLLLVYHADRAAIATETERLRDAINGFRFPPLGGRASC